MKQYTRGGYSQRGKRGQGRVYSAKVGCSFYSLTIYLFRPNVPLLLNVLLRSPALSKMPASRVLLCLAKATRNGRPPARAAAAFRDQRKRMLFILLSLPDSFRKSPEKRATPPKHEERSLTAERIRSKNGQPARRTCRSPSDGKTNQPEENQLEQNKVGLLLELPLKMVF